MMIARLAITGLVNSIPPGSRDYFVEFAKILSFVV